MAFKDIVFRRVDLLITRLKETPVAIDWDSKLGVPPIGFDPLFISGEFRGHVNGNAVGFGDLLTRVVAKSEVSTSTSVADLVGVIVKKSSISSRDLYEAKMRERARLGLRRRISSLGTPPINEEDILPTKKVADYVADPAINTLSDALNGDFRKYLIGGQIARGDLNGTVLAANDRIVLCMLA